MLRSLLSGNIDFFERRSPNLPSCRARVSALLHDRRAAGFKASTRAGLPESTYPAFRAAIEAMHETGFADAGGNARLRRRMVERVLTHCADAGGRVEPLMMLLRRYATEAAREEARLFCDELVETTVCRAAKTTIAA